MRVRHAGDWLSGSDAERTLDRDRLLGEGLFETVHVRDGVPLHLDAHLARLSSSARAFGRSGPAAGEIADAAAITRALWKDADRPERAALRLTLSWGAGRGLAPPSDPTEQLTWSLAPLPARELGTCAPPARAVVVSAHRVDPGAAVSGHKTLSALPWVLARRAATDRGADLALVRTVDGDVVEADAANLFLVVDDVVLTPGCDRGVLPGVTRARALAAFAEHGRSVREAPIDAAAEAGASEMFLTSSLDGVRPLAVVDDRELSAPGPVAAWLAGCLGD